MELAQRRERDRPLNSLAGRSTVAVRSGLGPGHLRKLYAGVYSSNLDMPAESVVLRHWRAIVGHLLPGGVISHRSAFDGRPQAGKLLLTRGRTRRKLEQGVSHTLDFGALVQCDAALLAA